MSPRSVSLAVALFVVACGAARSAPDAPSAASAPAAASSVSHPLTRAPQSSLLTRGTVRLLGTLKDPMKVDFYATTGTPLLDDFVSHMRALLAEYERAAQGKLHFVVTDVKTRQERRRAEQAGVVEMELPAGADDGRIPRKGYLGLAFRYGSKRDAIAQLYPQKKGLEFWIATPYAQHHLTATILVFKNTLDCIVGEDDLLEATLR